MEEYRIMTTLFVKHKVADYDRWKQGYDDFNDKRKGLGINAASVHRTPDDPDTIIITHRFKDTASAQAFMNAEDLKSAMQEAGVIGPPEIWFGEDVEQKNYS
jgi:quinol monooxygenase YgiN